MWHKCHWPYFALWFISSDFLAPLHYDFYAPLTMPLSTFLTTIQNYYLTSLFSFGTSIIAPLLPTPILLPHFYPLAFTPIHSNPIWSTPSVMYSQRWLLRSFSSIIYPLWTALTNHIRPDSIKLNWISSIWIILLRSAVSFAPLDLLIYLKVTYH